jgi:hypothetical protein
VGSGGKLHSYFDLGTRWGEWSASSPGRFTPRERASGTHWIGGWVDPEPFWMRWWRKKFPAPTENRTLESRSFSPKPNAIPTELSRLFVVMRMYLLRSETCHFGCTCGNSLSVSKLLYSAMYIGPHHQIYFISLCWNIRHNRNVGSVPLILRWLIAENNIKTCEVKLRGHV